MALIDCSIPSLLGDCAGGRTRFQVEAETLEQALSVLRETYPLLRVHLFDETGAARKHVLLFYNDDNLDWLDRLDLPLRPGDRLTVLQAVSGG